MVLSHEESPEVGRKLTWTCHKCLRAHVSAPPHKTSIRRSPHGVRWLLEPRPLLPHSTHQEKGGGTKWHGLLNVPPNTSACIPLAETYSYGHTSLGGWEMKSYSQQITSLKKENTKRMQLRRQPGGPATKGYRGLREPKRSWRSRMNTGQKQRAFWGPGRRNGQGRTSLAVHVPLIICSYSSLILPALAQDSNSQTGASKRPV